MISFKQSSSLLDIETAYSELSGTDSDVIRIPTALRHGGGVGVTPAFFQFLAAWSRIRPRPILRLYSSEAPSAALDAFAQEPHGMAALYFAPTFADTADKIQPSRVGLAYAVPRIEAMQAGRFRETMHGRGAFLACFAGARNEYLLPFYSKGKSDSLRGREDFARVTEQLILACAPNAIRKFSPHHIKAITNLVYELFRNTDEHAQLDENGHRYHRNMRGLMAKFISRSKSTISSEATGQDIPQNLFMLRTLANSRIHKDTNGSPRAVADAAFLELTVFDTGPGLARRWMSKNAPDKTLEDISIDEEMKFVLNCFEQHATTKDSDVSGLGLGLVVSALREVKAFLRLRTGRICLFQDFSSTTNSAFSPKHWIKERPELALAPGASYSIIIPLSRGME